MGLPAGTHDKSKPNLTQSLCSYIFVLNYIEYIREKSYGDHSQPFRLAVIMEL
jgi:hypothetical protein